jgi:ribosomal protein S18 acetylase RimI-like enzyme
MEVTTDEGQYRLLQEAEYPWELLLEADPSRAQIEKYLPRSSVYALIFDELIAGVVVLTPLTEKAVEITSIAVVEARRGQGLGRRLLKHAIETARIRGCTRIEIGTGNSGQAQLHLYQSAGFAITGIDRGYFVRNYPEPIEENGVPCVDMIRLTMEL